MVRKKTAWSVKLDLANHLPEDSWFRKWMNVWPLAESPKSFILMSGMAMLGAALGRRCYFDSDIHRTFPLLNLLLISPSGIGKSTALRDMALEHLIRPLPDGVRPQIITGKSTKEALHEDLYTTPHSIILASELANFFSKEKYQEGMIPYITDLLDLAPASVRTKGGGPAKIIKEPACCLLGGSTKEWLQDQLPSTASEGGFLPRFLIIKEDYKQQKIADPRRAMSRTQARELDKERTQVCALFRYLCDVEGLIDFEDWNASDTYSIWYQSYTPATGNLSPFAARSGAHVLRLALLSAVSCDRVAITAADVKAGIALFDYSMKKLQEVIVPMSSQGKMINKVLEAVGQEEMTLISIRRAMRNYCAAQDVDRMVTSLMDSGDITLQDGKYSRRV